MLAFVFALPSRAGLRPARSALLLSPGTGRSRTAARWAASGSGSTPRPRGAWDLDAADAADRDRHSSQRGRMRGGGSGGSGGSGTGRRSDTQYNAADARRAPQEWRDQRPQRGSNGSNGGGDEWRRSGGERHQGEWRDRSPRRGDGPREYAREGPPSELQLALASDTHDLLYGVSPVLAALRTGRRLCTKLFVQEDRASGMGSGTGGWASGAAAASVGHGAASSSSAGPSRKPGQEASMQEILRLAATLDITVRRLNKGDLNVLASNRPHQGFVLQATRLEYEDISTLGPAPKAPPPQDRAAVVPADAVVGDDSVSTAAVAPELGPVWLVLDEVTDPQNFGALVRSAHFLGAAGVIACRRNSSALTAAVSKASSGALEVTRVRGVASMPRFLRAAAADGWRVVGTALTAGAVRTSDLERGPPTLLVLGSEGRGLRPMVQEACDVLLRIDGRTERALDDPVDSLNVSVAGAIALHHLVAQ